MVNGGSQSHHVIPMAKREEIPKIECLVCSPKGLLGLPEGLLGALLMHVLGASSEALGSPRRL